MANGTGKVPVFQCVRGAWVFLIENWRLFLPAALVVALVSQVGPMLAVATAPSTPQPQSMLQTMLGNLMIYAPAMIVGVMYSAAILRKAIRDEFVGRVGLTFGADESRLVGVALGVACLFIPLIALVVVVLTIAVFSKIASSPEALQILLEDAEAMNNAITAALGESGAAALSLFILLATAIFIYLAARLYLVNAATIGERRMMIFQTWSWSRGNVMRVIGAMILTVLPVMLIDSIVDSLSASVLLSLGNASQQLVPWLLARVFVTFVGAITTIPVVALGAVLYKGLRPADFVAK